jgi:hypothetical protein
MRIKRDQKGAVSVEQIAWLALTVIALVIMGSVFVPALKNSVVNTVKDTTVKSYSMYSLSCPTGTLPAKVNAVNGIDGSGNGKYTVSFGALGDTVHGLRPASHQSSSTFSVIVNTVTYICVLDNANSGAPNPVW